MKKTLFVALGVIAVLLFAFPWLVSSRPGTAIFESMVQGKHTSLSVGSLKIRWFGPQKASLILWKTPNAEVKAEAIEIEASLFSLLLREGLKVKWVENAPPVLESLSVKGMKVTSGTVTASNGVRVEDIQLTLKTHGRSVQLIGSGEVENQPFNLEISHFDALWKWKIQGERLPTVVLQPFFSNFSATSLLGPTFNIDSEGALSRQVVAKTALTSNLLSVDAEWEGLIEELRLSSPLTVAWDITGPVAQKCIRQWLPNIEVHSPFRLNVNCDVLSFNPFHFSWDTIEAKASASLSPTRITLGKLLSLERTTIQCAKQKQVASIQVDTQAQYADFSPSTLSSEIKCTKPEFALSSLSSVRLSLKNAPVALIENFSKVDVEPFLGNTLSIEVDSPTFNTFKCTLTSPLCNINSLHAEKKEENWHLSSPYPILWQVSTTLLPVLYPVNTKLELKEMMVNDKLEGSLNMLFNSDPLALDLPVLKTTHVSDLFLSVQGKSFADLECLYSANIKTEAFTRALGGVCHLEGKAIASLKDKKPHLPQFTLNINSESIKASGSAAIDKNQHLHLLSPSMLSWTIPPHALHRFIPNMLDQVPLLVEIKELESKLDNFLPKLQCAFTANIKEMLLASEDGIPLALSDLNFNGNINKLHGNWIFQGTAQAQQQKGDFQVKGKLDPKKMSADLNMTNLPSLAIDAFYPEFIHLSPLLGKKITGKIQWEREKQMHTLAGRIDTELLSCKGDVTTTQNSTSIHDLEGQYLLTAKGYEALKGQLHLNPSIHFESASAIVFSLKDVATQHTWDTTTGKGHIGCPKLSFMTKKETTHVEAFDLKLDKKEKTAFDFSTHADVVAGQQKGSMKAQGKAQDVHNLSIKLESTNLPTKVLDVFHEASSLLLGNFLNMHGKLELREGQGPCILQLHSSQLDASLEGVCYKNKLHLTSPFTSALTLSEEFRKYLYGKSAVFIASVQSPITLTIPKAHFSIPLNQHWLEEGEFRNGRCNIGKLTVANRGNIQTINDILKIHRSHVPLWFAPCDFHLKQGTLDIERTEILYDQKYEIACWGEIFPVKQQIDMTLGLTASALRQALGIKNISSDYVLQIPVRGSFGNIAIDKQQAVTQIGILIASQEGKRAGGIWGGIFDVAGDIFSKQASVPPPKKPFPWD